MTKKKIIVPKKSIAKKPVKKVKKPREPKIGNYNGIEYESFCELSLLFFAEELKVLGYVDRVERCPTYLLTNPVYSDYPEQLKTKTKDVSQMIQHGASYTPDFDIYFYPSALGKVIWELNGGKKWDRKLLVAQKVGELYRVCCEVKPDFSRASTTPKSMQSMKWLYQVSGVYVNLFRPNDIFERLFCPNKYLTTESGGLRKLKYVPLSIEKFFKNKK